MKSGGDIRFPEVINATQLDTFVDDVVRSCGGDPRVLRDCATAFDRFVASDLGRSSDLVGGYRRLLAARPPLPEGPGQRFQMFLRGRVRCAGAEPFDLQDFWRQAIRDFHTYEAILDQIDGVAAQILVAGREAVLGERRGEIDEHAPQGPLLSTLIASMQSLDQDRSIFKSYSSQMLDHAVEVGLAGGLAHRVNNFHSAWSIFPRDLGRLGELWENLLDDLGAFRSALSLHREPFAAFKDMFLVGDHPLPHLEIVLPPELPAVGAKRPVAFLTLVLELTRLAAGRGNAETPNRLEFAWDEGRREMLMTDRLHGIIDVWNGDHQGRSSFLAEYVAPVGADFRVLPQPGGVLLCLPLTLSVPTYL